MHHSSPCNTRTHEHAHNVGRCLHTVQHHTDYVTALAASEATGKLLSAGLHSEVIMYDMQVRYKVTLSLVARLHFCWSSLGHTFVCLHHPCLQGSMCVRAHPPLVLHPHHLPACTCRLMFLPHMHSHTHHMSHSCHTHATLLSLRVTHMSNVTQH